MQPINIATVPSNASVPATNGNDVIHWLASAGTQSAVVSRIENNLVTLAFGSKEVTAQNSLQLKIGDRVNVRIDQSSGTPVIKVNLPDAPSQQTITILLKGMPPVKTGDVFYGHVKSFSDNYQNLELLQKIIRLPLQTRWPDGQFIKAVAVNEQNQFNLSPANPLSHLIPALSRMLANHPSVDPANQSLSDLRSMLVTLHRNQASDTVNKPDNPAMSSELKRISSAINVGGQLMNSANPGKASENLTNVFERSPLLGQFSSSLHPASLFKAGHIQQWIQNTFQSPLSIKDAPFWPMTSLRPSFVKQIQTSINNALNHKLELSIKNQDIDTQQVARLLRDIASTLDSLDQNNLMQQLKLKTQQELQQPMAFNLQLPYQNGDRLDWVKLSLQQKSLNPSQEDSWKIRLEIVLPELGQLISIVQLKDLDIGIDFWVENNDIQSKFHDALPTLKQQLTTHGFLLTHCECQIGNPPEQDGPASLLPEGENFLDIRV